MEVQLANSHPCTELNTASNNDSHKAWHLLALLLALGRPARPTELASRCTFFRATPEFIAFLCSVPDSPIDLTADLFVTISSVAFIAFGQFALGANRVSAVVPVMRLGDYGRKRVWEDVVQTYYRKRKRLNSDTEFMPEVKRGMIWNHMDAESQGRIVLALANRTQNASAEVNFCVDDDMTRDTSNWPGNMSFFAFDLGKRDNMFTTPWIMNSGSGLLSDGLKNTEQGSSRKTNTCLYTNGFGYVYTSHRQCHYLEYRRSLFMPNQMRAGRRLDCMNRPELSLLSGALQNPVVNRASQVDFSFSSPIDFKATHSTEIDKKETILRIENEEVIHANEEAVQDESIMEEKLEEPLIDYSSYNGVTYNLPIGNTGIGTACKDNAEEKMTVRYNSTLLPLDEEKTIDIESRPIIPADTISVGQEQQIESSPTTNVVQKDTLSHNPDIFSKALECRAVVGALTGKQDSKIDKKSFSMKQKQKSKYAKEKREILKEKGGKSVFISQNNQSQKKELPKFESFMVEEEEGSGGYGTVYRARRKNDGTTFAIKCPHVNANKHHVQNELMILERFGGKNFVIKYEGSFKSGNSDCLVLEHVEHDRPEVLKREIDVFELQWYGYCMFKALAGLHKQGIVHRDVKPGNFLFSRKVNKGYLIDFNLAMDLHKKHGCTDKPKASDVNFDRVALPHGKSLHPNKTSKFPTTKAVEGINREAGRGSKSILLPKNLKKKADQAKVYNDLGSRSLIKSQGGDGSGITSVKDGNSARTPSTERLREPIPSHGRKELLSLVQEALQSPKQEVVRIPVAKRKRISAPSGRVYNKALYLTPMPLHSAGIAIAGSGLLKSKGDGKHKHDGPCVGTKGFRAPEVLFRSPHQGPKVDVWSAGVTILYLMIGRTPFVGDPDQNLKEIAKLMGSEDLWEVAKLHNRESSFPPDLLDVKLLPSTKLRDWCEANTRRPDFMDIVPRSLYDLLGKCLTVNPRLRMSAEEALRHEFFFPCHEALRKQRLIRQGIGLDSGN